MPPSGAKGNITFYATIAKTKETFWIKLPSNAIDLTVRECVKSIIIFFPLLHLTIRQRAQVVYEQLSMLSKLSMFIDNEGELSNCFSINQLVGQNELKPRQF